MRHEHDDIDGDMRAWRDYELTMLLDELAYPNPITEVTRKAWGYMGPHRESIDDYSTGGNA